MIIYTGSGASSHCGTVIASFPGRAEPGNEARGSTTNFKLLDLERKH